HGHRPTRIREKIQQFQHYPEIFGSNFGLTDGCVEIDSNIVERAIRPQAITRKNSLFAGSDGGGKTWATIATLLQTAKMNAVDPQAWLTQALERFANGWPSSEIDALMPWNYTA
ncbi:transposase domain-containing protein, partial [Rhizobium leguminosarum]|uniref:transposase domain-containing protein n=1 Tax=Rhizobium leguminosarum TaxID=384 RepID=UPI001FEFA08A